MMLPEKVVAVYIHYPLYCFDGDNLDTECKVHRPLPEDMALLFHYRSDKFNETDFSFKNVTNDTTMWKYKDDLIREVAITLNETGYVP